MRIGFIGDSLSVNVGTSGTPVLDADGNVARWNVREYTRMSVLTKMYLYFHQRPDYGGPRWVSMTSSCYNGATPRTALRPEQSYKRDLGVTGGYQYSPYQAVVVWFSGVNGAKERDPYDPAQWQLELDQIVNELLFGNVTPLVVLPASPSGFEWMPWREKWAPWLAPIDVGLANEIAAKIPLSAIQSHRQTVKLVDVSGIWRKHQDRRLFPDMIHLEDAGINLVAYLLWQAIASTWHEWGL